MLVALYRPILSVLDDCCWRPDPLEPAGFQRVFIGEVVFEVRIRRVLLIGGCVSQRRHGVTSSEATILNMYAST